ncbi:MAG: thiamine pyrophosphate-binding protein [Chloroflexi bacterium]|nr:thiamine pyrophosphate-binding protein [Chloroflexota bacterium]MYD49411.1 thiamine pyrophosphate-binding protein [Chloroflexota bacterium]
MPQMTGGEAVVASLQAQGVDTVFGIISVHTLDLFDALFDHQDDVRFIGGRLELGCGYMADGYSRATGKPGVLLTSTGPGAADSVGAMGEAYFSASSILQVTTNVEAEFVGSGKMATHETKDQLGMFAAVTDWNARIGQIESIPDHFVEAFVRFRERRPRPIELEVPTDFLGQQADVEVLQPREPEVPQGDPVQVERAWNLLRNAKRPVIFLGEEIHTTGGADDIIQLAERLGAPVVTGDGAKGTFPENHPLSLGMALGNRIWGHNPVLDWLGDCDVALVLGSNLPYRSTAGVGLKLPQKIVHVLLDGDYIGKNFDTEVGITANSGAVARQFLSAAGDTDISAGDDYRNEVAGLKEQIYARLQEQWGPELRAWESIRSVIPDDTIFSLDATVPANRAVRCLQMNRTRSYMYPHGWAGLGFGFPAAMGAKVGRPQSPVICVTGDGGFQYNAQELGTAVQYGINPIVMVFNDSAWGVLKGYQQARGSRQMATDLVNPDFIKLFDSYGIGGTRVHNVAEMSRAVQDAVAADRIHLIEVVMPDGFPAFCQN